MLPKRYRLSNSWLFTKTMQQGTKFFSRPCLSLKVLAHWRPQTELGLPRLGFMVSKKVHKRAVRRNRLRRVLREHYRQAWLPRLQEGLPHLPSPPATLVWWLHAPAVECSNAALRQVMDEALTRLFPDVSPCPPK